MLFLRENVSYTPVCQKNALKQNIQNKRSLGLDMLLTAIWKIVPQRKARWDDWIQTILHKKFSLAYTTRLPDQVMFQVLFQIAVHSLYASPLLGQDRQSKKLLFQVYQREHSYNRKQKKLFVYTVAFIVHEYNVAKPVFDLVRCFF